jgi:hypothetical protein
MPACFSQTPFNDPALGPHAPAERTPAIRVTAMSAAAPTVATMIDPTRPLS